MTADPLLECAGLSEAQLADVLELVAGTDVVELEVSFGGGRLSLRRPAQVAQPAPERREASGAPDLQDGAALAVTSPLVGIFHPVVAAGDPVQPGQSIGAIEALGMPTSVDAPQSGTVEQLLVFDGSPVEYGQPLLVLRRTPRERTSPPAV